MNQNDFQSLCKILQDEDTMYAYEGAFNDEEVQNWLDRQISRYQKWDFGLWAVILKETDEMIGQCGLTMQPWKDEEVLEILKANEVCSIIRDTNIASQKVAIRNRMCVTDSCTKHYKVVDMPHYRYVTYRR